MIYPDGKDPNDSHMKGIKPHVASQSGSAGCDVWYREAGLTARFVIKFSGHTMLTKSQRRRKTRAVGDLGRDCARNYERKQKSSLRRQERRLWLTVAISATKAGYPIVSREASKGGL